VAGEAVTLADGRHIEPDDVLGRKSRGQARLCRRCRPHDNLLDVAHEADALVIEATYLNEDAEMARQFSHLTAARVLTWPAKPESSSST